MTAAGIDLKMARREAISRMTETFQFFTTATVLDPDTLEDTVTETELGVTIGRLKMSNSQGRDVESGNQYAVVSRLEIHLPSTDTSALAPSPWILPGVVIPAVSYPVGCSARCIDSSADLSLIGRVFRVTERPQAGQTTAHRYAVEEVS